jgi:hypothetical protein
MAACRLGGGGEPGDIEVLRGECQRPTVVERGR